MEENNALAEEVESLKAQMAQQQGLVMRGLAPQVRKCLKDLELNFDSQLSNLIRYGEFYAHVCPATTSVFPLELYKIAAQSGNELSRVSDGAAPGADGQALGAWCAGIRSLDKFGKSAHALFGSAPSRPTRPACPPLSLLSLRHVWGCRSAS